MVYSLQMITWQATMDDYSKGMFSAYRSNYL